MPKFLHEGLLELFRSRVTLAPELLERVFNAPPPAFTRIEVAESNLTELLPTEMRADLVLLLQGDKPVLGIIVEVQLEKDERKLFSWPLYTMMLRNRHRCPVELLVVTPTDRVARWAAQAIEFAPGQSFTPRVLGRESIPVVTPEEAVQAPEFGVLSAIAHAKEPQGLKLALSVIPSFDSLDDELRRVYYDLLTVALPEAAQKELEAMALSGNYEYQSDFAKKFLAQGVAQGAHRTQIEMLLKGLQQRGFSVSTAAKKQIEQATTEQLDQWFLRLFDAKSIEDVLKD